MPRCLQGRPLFPKARARVLHGPGDAQAHCQMALTGSLRRLVEIWDKVLRPASDGHWGEKSREIQAQVAISCLKDTHTGKSNCRENLRVKL